MAKSWFFKPWTLLFPLAVRRSLTTNPTCEISSYYYHYYYFLEFGFTRRFLWYFGETLGQFSMKFWQLKPISPSANTTCFSALPKVENVSHLQVLARLLKDTDPPERGFLSPSILSENFYSPIFYRDQTMTNKEYEVISWSPINCTHHLVSPSPAWLDPQ